MMLSIMGMYEYDNSIFDGLEVPSFTDPETNTFHVLDKDVLIKNILLHCAELEIVYPSSDTMKMAIGVWAASELNSWTKLYATTMAAYNPIWNVDANISQKRNIDRDIDVSDRVNISGNNTHSVQGFNSPAWAAAEKDDYSNNSTDTAHTDDVTGETFTERRTGNIGVTATQDLIKKEREIADFSMIEYITMSFKKRFCILIY